jgi:hypothetical protein
MPTQRIQFKDWLPDQPSIIDTVSEANSAVWFDSKTWHKSSPPITNKQRVVINFILEVEPD